MRAEEQRSRRLSFGVEEGKQGRGEGTQGDWIG